MAYSFSLHPVNIFIAIFLNSLLVNAQNGDGGSADGFSNSNLGAAGTGADGSSNSSANLSKGAIIAIAVVVAVVVLLGVTLAVLFYLAKKRQWQVRQTIRRTATKAVRAMTPRTPSRMSFSPRSPRADKQTHAFMDRNKTLNSERNNRDVEKGFTSIDTRMERTSQETSNSKTASPQQLLKGEKKNGLGLTVDSFAANGKPNSTHTPSSQFNMECPKSPMWQRILGRK